MTGQTGNSDAGSCELPNKLVRLKAWDNATKI